MMQLSEERVQNENRPSARNSNLASKGRRFTAATCITTRTITTVAVAIATALVQPSASAATGAASRRIAAPAPAAKADYSQLVFEDDFDSVRTIDVNGTCKPGYKWYVDRPVWGSGITLPSAYSVSNSFLTVSSTGDTASWAVASFSPRGGVGHSFKYGYFEARIRFDPTLGPTSKGWPAWWSLSTRHSRVNNPDHWAELDFFEAYTGGKAGYQGAFVGTVHDWADGSKKHFQNSNNWKPLPKTTDFNQWHTYGCLWRPGEITWYFDDAPLMSQAYSATTPPMPPANGTTTPTPAGVFSILDREPEGMLLILGSGPEWPMDVDWVRVWQSPNQVPTPSETTEPHSICLAGQSAFLASKRPLGCMEEDNCTGCATHTPRFCPHTAF